jgi:hypothetical protein
MRILACICLLAATAPACAAAPSAFRYSRLIEWPDSGREALLSATLDEPVYAVARDDYADLRVFDEKGAETPFLLEKIFESRREIARERTRGKAVSLRPTGANGIEAVLRLEANAPPATMLSLLTPMTNHEHRVQVFGARDGKAWTPLVGDALVFDYSRYMDVSNRDIPLPQNAYRWFKLRIEEADQTRESPWLALNRKNREGDLIERGEWINVEKIPFRIDGVEFWGEAERATPPTEKKLAYSIKSFAAHRDSERKLTLIEIETFRPPLTRLSLQTSSRNFSRKATLQIPEMRGMETRMRDIAEATLQSLSFRGFEREQAALSFPGRRQGKYRVTIRDEDNPPLDIADVKAEGDAYRLAFLATPGKTYTLHYGAERIEPAHYETSPLLETLRREYRFEEARLGPERAAPERPAETRPNIAKILNDERFLGAVMSLAAAVLIWALVKAGKRVERSSED